MRDGGQQVAAIMQQARQRHLAPEELQVIPRVRVLPAHAAERVSMPPLLKAYLKLGAWVAGEPCLDPDFNVADVFILLDLKNLNTHYHRHFIQAETKHTMNELLPPYPPHH
jgi:putative hemolysin